MNNNKYNVVAILLIIAGALGLAYGGFSYTKDTHQADVGPIQISIDEKKNVNVPVWVGVAMITLGGVMLVSSKKV